MKSFKREFLNEGLYPYFIAEIGINHNGHYDLAKQMIDKSKEAGADAVKFQKRDIQALVLSGVEIPEPTGYLSRDENDISSKRKAYGTWVYPDKRIELNDEEFKKLWRYSEEQGLDFLVSPWEESSVDFLVANGAKAIKLASIDTTNYMFCEYIASKGIPTIVSTGMSNYAQLNVVFDIFQKAKCPMMFLHCTSAYPSELKDKNLQCIPIMQSMFNMDIGFSGHGVGDEGTLGAVALGANVIEKHVTLNNKMNGTDHEASLEFPDFQKLIAKCGNIVVALGHGRKEFLASEQVLHGVLSKRIVTSCEIRAGENITKEMLGTKVTKLEGGLLPDQYYDLLGCRATRDLGKDHIMMKEDFI